MISFVLRLILISIGFYFIGSIPVAYLLAKTQKIDITKSGSGNVGALNSFEVTKSKTIGILVLVLDLLKGFLPAFILTRVFDISFNVALLPLIMLIAGHNFSIFLKFKGGRGLAASAGISLAVNFWMLVIWGVFFLISFLIKRNVHIANVIASVFLPVTILAAPEYFPKFNFDYNVPMQLLNYHFFDLFILSASVCILILIRHIQPIAELIKKSRKK